MLHLTELSSLQSGHDHFCLGLLLRRSISRWVHVLRCAYSGSTVEGSWRMKAVVRTYHPRNIVDIDSVILTSILLSFLFMWCCCRCLMKTETTRQHSFVAECIVLPPLLRLDVTFFNIFDCQNVFSPCPTMIVVMKDENNARETFLNLEE